MTKILSGYRKIKKIGFHSDVYSIGAMLFFKLFVRKPCEADCRIASSLLPQLQKPRPRKTTTKQKMNTGMRKMPKRRWKLRLSASVCRTG